MSTATISPHPTASPRLDRPPVPVGVEPAEQAGRYWIKETGQLPILVALKNLWAITEVPDEEMPRLRMNFRATTEDGRQFRLFQDLLDGKWYRDLAPWASGQLL